MRLASLNLFSDISCLSQHVLNFWLQNYDMKNTSSNFRGRVLCSVVMANEFPKNLLTIKKKSFYAASHIKTDTSLHISVRLLNRLLVLSQILTQKQVRKRYKILWGKNIVIFFWKRTKEQQTKIFYHCKEVNQGKMYPKRFILYWLEQHGISLFFRNRN
jgi:hypothetical protein